MSGVHGLGREPGTEAENVHNLIHLLPPLAPMGAGSSRRALSRSGLASSNDRSPSVERGPGPRCTPVEGGERRPRAASPAAPAHSTGSG